MNRIFEKNKQIANNWLDAFNSRNLEKLLSSYDDLAQHYSPKLKQRMPHTQGLIKGKESLRTWWRDAFDRLPSLHYELVRLTADEEQVFIEYIRKVNGEEDMAIAEVLRIQDGLIVFSRVYHG